RSCGYVDVVGGSVPAVRVSLDPQAFAIAGVSLDQVRQTLSAENPLRPLGYLADGEEQLWLSTGGQMNAADEIAPLIIRWDEDGALRLRDVAQVEDSVEDLYNL